MSGMIFLKIIHWSAFLKADEIKETHIVLAPRWLEFNYGTWLCFLETFLNKTFLLLLYSSHFNKTWVSSSILFQEHMGHIRCSGWCPNEQATFQDRFVKSIRE